MSKRYNKLILIDRRNRLYTEPNDNYFSINFKTVSAEIF